MKNNPIMFSALVTALRICLFHFWNTGQKYNYKSLEFFVLFSYNPFANLPKYSKMEDNLSLHEVMVRLEEDDIAEVRLIVILPSENATKPVSDEDSGEEDGGTVNNLPGSLLRAPAFFAKDSLVDAFPEDDRRHLPECNSLSNVVASCANILQSPAFQAPSSSAEQPPTAKKKKIAKFQENGLKKI